MRYFFLLLLSIICTATISGGQSVFYDARKIADLHPSIINDKVSIPNNTAVYKLLRNYVSDRDSTKNLIGDAFKDNPFISVQSPAGGEAMRKSSLSSVIGGVDVTNIADGLAKFLIKRGKEELNMAFFQRMKDFLNENEEAKTLFPATSVFLNKIESYRYSELLQSLREAFYKDISNLVVNLNLLIDLPKYQQLLKALPEIRVAVRSAKIISELSRGASMAKHPADLIHKFAALKEWGEMNINLQSSWQVLDRISESVREKAPEIFDTTFEKIRIVDTIRAGGFIPDTVSLPGGYFTIRNVAVGREPAFRIQMRDTFLVTARASAASPATAWIKFSDFNDYILSDPIALKIFIGLLYERMDSITFRNAEGKYTSVQDFMRENKDNIFKIADLIENFLVLANDVEMTIKDIREKKGDLTNDDYYTYIRKAIDITEYGFKVANVIKPGIADDRYITMARNAADLYKNIYTKSYNAAVMNVYVILEEILAKSDSAVDSKKNFYTSLQNDPLFQADTSIRAVKLSQKDSFTRSNDSLRNTKLLTEAALKDRAETVERILRYGNLIASIVKAENSDEAAAAIEAAVLPAGSSSVKKNSKFNISLNAYIGGYFGRSTNATDEIDGNNSAVGVTAPVGVAFSWGLGYYKNGNIKGYSRGAISLYATLIDVGAIAGYRLNDDSTALDQKVTLNQIFTPGGYVVYGFGLPIKGFSYIPLSVGYGWQYGSKLYQKKDDGKLATSDKSRWRSNWFVAIDIPLVNFWTRNNNKKK